MLKIFKQELLFIPLMLLMVEAVRAFLFSFYPETAMFDRGSEVETFLVRFWQVTWITCAAWILLRVVFPAAHKALKAFYVNFDKMDETVQRSFSIKMFIVFFFGLVFLMTGRASTRESYIRTSLVDTLNDQLHVRELTGNNDGVDVERYLKFVGHTKGAPYCAAFVSYNLNAVGVSTPPNPKSAWSPNFAKEPYVIYSAKMNKQHKLKHKVQAGDCFTLFYPKLNRVGHVGFILSETDSYYITIEGNTAPGGTREGSGVHKLKRPKNKIYAITNYITPFANEKTINPFPVTTYGNIMLPEVDGKYRKNIGYNRSAPLQNRYIDSTRYCVDVSSGFSTPSGECGHNSKPSGDDLGKCQDKTYAINPKRESASRLCLQRIRGEGSVARKANKGACILVEPEAPRQKRYSYKRGEVYTQVG